MGKKIKKQVKQGYMTMICPNCGNDIPNRRSAFNCKYCHYYIRPDENIVKEFREK